jgi:hypothetical protein
MRPDPYISKATTCIEHCFVRLVAQPLAVAAPALMPALVRVRLVSYAFRDA